MPALVICHGYEALHAEDLAICVITAVASVPQQIFNPLLQPVISIPTANIISANTTPAAQSRLNRIDVHSVTMRCIGKKGFRHSSKMLPRCEVPGQANGALAVKRRAGDPPRMQVPTVTLQRVLLLGFAATMRCCMPLVPICSACRSFVCGAQDACCRGGSSRSVLCCGHLGRPIVFSAAAVSGRNNAPLRVGPLVKQPPDVDGAALGAHDGGAAVDAANGSRGGHEAVLTLQVDLRPSDRSAWGR